MADVLKKFDEEKLLDDTILYIYSDHGDHIDFLMWNTVSGYSELMNPPMFVMVPDHLAEKHHDNLTTNSQRLITHHQIFNNNIKYIEVTPSDRTLKGGYTLFYDTAPVKGTCESEHVFEDCKCFLPK